ncbi:pentatricopeptide repeat-containing protein At2g19280-like [Dioscorea cayenensis subsp. rotundata]|uniref:Pentatricopeptide repeat-containing protein At2g19280-like n=1 Tax=Dioscorea cayennensis subsp. rotundata TaxID=55577 RepID=A0AB40CEV0_DIOCR|nr:pentatricopeptide repeat-containing protein At2g19280-like [Dioscorea cayenensis subsp. rotundata]
MAASRCLRCKPRAFNPIHRLLRRSSHSRSPPLDPPSRMHSFTRPWLPRNILNARIEAFLKAGGFDICFLNSELDDLDFSRVLSHLFDVSSDAALAFYFFRLYQRSHGIQHNLRTLCTLIHISVSGNLNHIAVNLLRRIVAELSEGEGEWIDLVFDILRDVSRERKDLEIVYSMLVRCCLDAGKVGAALQLMERMKRFGFFPSVGVYVVLFETLLESGQLSLAWEVFVEMPSLDNCSSCMFLGLFVHAFVKHGDFGGAWKLVREMWSGGVGVDVFICTTVIHGRMLEGAKVFRSFPECVPDVFMYNSFMLQLCRDGNVIEANRMLNEMFEVGRRSSESVLSDDTKRPSAECFDIHRLD